LQTKRVENNSLNLNTGSVVSWQTQTSEVTLLAFPRHRVDMMVQH
jgi:hypothetical protein